MENKSYNDRQQQCAINNVSAIAELLVCICGSNNWETVADRWVHDAWSLAIHPCNILRNNRRDVSKENKKLSYRRVASRCLELLSIFVSR